MRRSYIKLQGKLYSGPQEKLEVSSIDELGEASGGARRLVQSGAGLNSSEVGKKASSEAKGSPQRG